MARHSKLWTPRFILFSLANITSSVIFYLLATSMASIAVRQFDASPTLAGAATGLYFIGAVAARLIAGPVVARLGIGRALLVSWLYFAATSAAYLLVTNLTELLALRLLHGVGFGLAATALTSAALSSVPASRRAEGTGWFTGGMALGTGLGPMIALNLLRIDGGQRTILLVTTVTGLLGLALVVIATRLRHAPEPQPHLHPRGRMPLVEPRTVPIATVAMLSAVAFSVVLTFLNDFATQASLQDAAGFFFLVYATTMLIMRPVMGRVQDAKGDRVVVIPSLVSIIVGLSLIASAHSGLPLLIGGALLGSGFGTMVSAGQAIAQARAEPGRATLAIASFFLLVDLGTGLGPTLLGGLIPVVGFRGIFLVGIVLAVIALFGYLTLVARRRSA